MLALSFELNFYVWVAIVFFVRMAAGIYATLSREMRHDINGTVISVAVVCCLIAFVRRFVLRNE